MVFSISAFILTLRETMEAALIVGILLAYLTKTENEQFKRDIWIGTGLAIFASVIGALIFEIAFGGFEGRQEEMFEGIVMISAAAVLTWMIIWMFRNARTLKYELEEKTELAITKNKKFALVGVAFLAVFREGIETVLFIAGVRASEDGFSVLMGSVTGIAVAITVAILLFRGTVELNIKQFFNVTSIILIIFAAGLFAHGIHEFQELGWFGGETSRLNEPLWDFSHILNDKDDGFGALLRALFGYQDKPSLLELLSYVFYWLAIALTFVKVNRDFAEKQQPATA